MRKLLIGLLVSVLFLNQSFAQTSFRDDVDKLVALLEKTPSYKDQVKGEVKNRFTSLVGKIKQDSALSDYDAFNKLASLFYTFRDNHLGFYQIPKMALSPTQLRDSNMVRSFRQSASFIDYPHVSMNLDSLEQKLSAAPADSVQGVYYHTDQLKIGLFESSVKGEYTGVVLSSRLPHWGKGQIAVRLFETGYHTYRAIYADPVYKEYMLYNNERFGRGSLLNSHFYNLETQDIYTKNPGKPDYTNIKGDAPAFSLSLLESGIQYLRLGNFSATTDDMKISQAFYDRIKDSLFAQFLIVDLRNNTGGAEKVSKKFLKLIQRFMEHGKVYILMNFNTMSQGEIFALQLMKLGAFPVGETTQGTIAYGSNYGKTELLPSKKFQVYLTDMDDSKDYLMYEGLGVQPSVQLKYDQDWIRQTLIVIKKQYSGAN